MTASEIKKFLPYAALALPAGFFLWPMLKELAGVYEYVPDFSHGYFVPVVSLYVVYLKWPQLLRIPAKTCWWGLPLLAVGGLVVLLGYWYEYAIDLGGQGPAVLGGVGLWAFIGGSTLFLLGPRRTWILVFPLAYLLFAVPYPQSVSLMITVPLREFVTGLSASALQLSGVEVYREGNILHLANVALGVEDVCSGIRSLWASLASGVAIGYLTGCRDLRMVSMVVMSIVLAILQNGLRIYTSGVLANRWGEHWAEGWRHETIGIITLTLALLALLGFGLRLAGDAEGGQEECEGEEDAGGLATAPKPKQLVAWAILAALLLVATGSRLGMERHYAGRKEVLARFEAQRKPLQEFPRVLGRFSCEGRTEVPEVLRRQVEDTLMPTDYFHGVYGTPGAPDMTVLLMYWNPIKLHMSHFGMYAHSPDWCLPGAGWEISEQRSPDLRLYDPEHEWLLHRVYSQSTNQKLVYFWTQREPGTSKPFVHQTRSVVERWQDMRNSWQEPLRNLNVKYSAAIYVDATRSLQQAEQVAAEFAAHLKAELQDYGFSVIEEVQGDHD